MNDILQNSKARLAHNQQKQILAEKYESKMLFAYAGGMWKAGPELVNVLSAMDGEIVLLDEYKVPVRVNVTELLEQVKMRWQEQMNAWHTEYNELSRQR